MLYGAVLYADSRIIKKKINLDKISYNMTYKQSRVNINIKLITNILYCGYTLVETIIPHTNPSCTLFYFQAAAAQKVIVLWIAS